MQAMEDRRAVFSLSQIQVFSSLCLASQLGGGGGAGQHGQAAGSGTAWVLETHTAASLVLRN